MDINRGNYELFFINFLEGQLNQDEMEALKAFLLLNPDLRDEFEEMQEFESGGPVFNNDFLFQGKENLHKSISEKQINTQNIDEFLIASLENDLDVFAQKRLDDFLDQNPAYFKNLELFKKTYQKPDLDIKFPEKTRLKKFVVGNISNVRRLYYAVAGVAAMVALLLTVFVNDYPVDTLQYGQKAGRENLMVHFNKQAYVSPDNTAENNLNETVNKNILLAQKDKMDAPNLMGKKTSLFVEQEVNHYLAYENRSEFSGIYHYVKLAEFNQIDEDYSDVLPEAPKQGFFRYTADKLMAARNNSNPDNEDMPVWQNAVDVGIYGINSLAKRELINVQHDDEKNKRNISFALGDNFSFSRR